MCVAFVQSVRLAASAELPSPPQPSLALGTNLIQLFLEVAPAMLKIYDHTINSYVSCFMLSGTHNFFLFL